MSFEQTYIKMIKCSLIFLACAMLMLPSQAEEKEEPASASMEAEDVNEEPCEEPIVYEEEEEAIEMEPSFGGLPEDDAPEEAAPGFGFMLAVCVIGCVLILLRGKK